MNARTILGMLALALVPFLIGQGGCDTLDEQPGTVRVEAPAGMCWSGSIGDSTKDGCGPASFDIQGEAIIVAVVQKQDAGKWPLKLILEIDGEVVDTSETTAEFGLAQVEEG